MSNEVNKTNFSSRRRFLKQVTASAATVAGGLPLLSSIGCDKGTNATAARAGDGPEKSKLSLGIIALTDCSPIVIAKEKGFFQKYGLDVTVKKGASWRAIHDSLSNGDIQGTHMLIGMPIASTMGLLDAGVKVPMVIPWLLNRNGQSISLKAALKGQVQDDPKALKPLVEAAKAAGKKMTFAMTFPPGTHAMWTRYWLAAGGINPDADVTLKVVPPANMVEQMESGNMDGFCVGEPWNARTVAKGIGYTGINTQDIWNDHPEKVCAFTADFAEKNPKTVKAVCKALHEASVWLDDLGNRPEQCEIVSKPNYINCEKDLILGRMLGKYDYGDGRTRTYDKHYMIFSSRNCNYPQPKYAAWWLTQLRRWGMVSGTPDYAGVAKQVMRTDLYEEAMKELNYTHGDRDDKPETLFDGKTFDPAKPDEYATSFAVHSMK
jgi:nitrate/nitrite transport system substrate-binding protein